MRTRLRQRVLFVREQNDEAKSSSEDASAYSGFRTRELSLDRPQNQVQHLQRESVTRAVRNDGA